MHTHMHALMHTCTHTHAHMHAHTRTHTPFIRKKAKIIFRKKGSYFDNYCSITYIVHLGTEIDTTPFVLEYRLILFISIPRLD